MSGWVDAATLFEAEPEPAQRARSVDAPRHFPKRALAPEPSRPRAATVLACDVTPPAERPQRPSVPVEPAVTPFGRMLAAFRTRARCSRNALAKSAGINATYITRMEAGQRNPPSRPIVEALASALRLGVDDCADFFVAAGHTPPALARLGTWDAGLTAVIEVLTDPLLTDDQKTEFRQVAMSAAKRWRGR